MTDKIEDSKEEVLEVGSLEKPLEQVVMREGPLKQHLVNYVGNKLHPENDAVTLEMIINVVADEFPEFVLALAEENFMRGYQQATLDIDFVQKQQLEPEVQLEQESSLLDMPVLDAELVNSDDE